MEININCDLGEKSKHHSNKHDPDLLNIVNSANVACGYHAGDDESMNQVVKISYYIMIDFFINIITKITIERCVNKIRYIFYHAMLYSRL